MQGYVHHTIFAVVVTRGISVAAIKHYADKSDAQDHVNKFNFHAKSNPWLVGCLAHVEEIHVYKKD